MKLKQRWGVILLFIFSILLPQFVGFLGAFFTLEQIPNWYSTLVRPSLSPPNWVFGPVWTILYLMMGVSLFLVLRKRKIEKSQAVTVFFVQLFLNLMWSIAFFGFQSIGGGLIVIIGLWIAILITILNFYKISKISSYLLMPYLAWVSFATYLNFAFFFLNR